MSARQAVAFVMSQGRFCFVGSWPGSRPSMCTDSQPRLDALNALARAAAAPTQRLLRQENDTYLRRCKKRCVFIIDAPANDLVRSAGSMGDSRPLLAQDWLVWPDLDRVVARLASRYRVSANDIPDIVQEVRLTLWKAGAERVVNATWIFKVVASRVMDHLRKRGACEPEFISSVAAALHQAPIVDAELAYLLAARASTLPARILHYYRLRYGQGLSEREVATSMHVSRSSVRWLDRRCRQALTGASV